MLSCECGEWDSDGWSWTYNENTKPLLGNKRKRCCSCKALIDLGSEALEFERMRYPKNDIEIRIHGDDYAEIPLASWFMCKECSELFLTFVELEYCIYLGEDSMKDLLKEYQVMTHFNQEAWETLCKTRTNKNKDQST